MHGVEKSPHGPQPVFWLRLSILSVKLALGGGSVPAPFKHKPLYPVAEVRLRFVQTFPQSAKSWDSAEQHPSDRPRRRLTNMELADKINKMRGNPRDGGLRETDITRLWSNNYGLRNTTNGALQHWAINCVFDLFKESFAEVIGQTAAAATSAMARSSIEFDDEDNKEASLTEFRARYDGIIDPLRSFACKPDELSIIAHYDDWVFYLTDRVADGAKRPDLYRDRLIEALDRAIVSGAALRKSLDDLPGSSITDLYRFQRLTNELQNHCASVGLKGTDGILELQNTVTESAYFAKLDRFLEIMDDSRVDEAQHGVLVACALGCDTAMRAQMKHYGLKMVKAMKRVLAAADEEVAPEHPVLNLQTPLFKGDEAPAKMRQLAFYLDHVHPEVLLESFAHDENPDSQGEDAGFDEKSA
jgi:hypothetical protein